MSTSLAADERQSVRLLLSVGSFRLCCVLPASALTGIPAQKSIPDEEVSILPRRWTLYASRWWILFFFSFLSWHQSMFCTYKIST